MDISRLVVVPIVLASLLFAEALFLRVAKAGLDGAREGAAHWFVRQRYAPALAVIVTAVVAVYFNAAFLGSVVMACVQTFSKPIEWLGIALSGLCAIFIDIRIARFLRRMRTLKAKKPNHVAQPTPASRRG